MNSFKLNGRSGSEYRRLICNDANIPFFQLYQEVKDITNDVVSKIDYSKLSSSKE